MFLADGTYYSDQAIDVHLTGSQWGVMNETGSYPGENIACTPGAVVYREELFELLQYTPTTPRVRSCPLVIVPPQVNRYYIIDLAPGRSLAEFAVCQGVQTFMISWRNPSSLLGTSTSGCCPLC